jgi:hypothetical protein
MPHRVTGTRGPETQQGSRLGGHGAVCCTQALRPRQHSIIIIGASEAPRKTRLAHASHDKPGGEQVPGEHQQSRPHQHTMSGKGWWNSAISGLESRLDTILAEDAQGNPRPRAADAAGKHDASEQAAAAAAAEKKLTVEPGTLGESP